MWVPIANPFPFILFFHFPLQKNKTKLQIIGRQSRCVQTRVRPESSCHQTNKKKIVIKYKKKWGFDTFFQQTGQTTHETIEVCLKRIGKERSCNSWVPQLLLQILYDFLYYHLQVYVCTCIYLLRGSWGKWVYSLFFVCLHLVNGFIKRIELNCVLLFWFPHQ